MNMCESKIDKARAKFGRVYANLPMDERRMPIAVIDSKPMSWNVCRDEIESKTRLSWRILAYLKKLELI
jgi:hypothetical protein